MSINSKWIVCATCMEAIKEVHLMAVDKDDALRQFREIFPVNQYWNVSAYAASDTEWVDGYRCDIGGYNYNS